MSELRENVRQIRLARSLPQLVLADELGIDVSAVCNFENGKRDFRIGSLPAIASALGGRGDRSVLPGRNDMSMSAPVCGLPKKRSGSRPAINEINLKLS